MIINRLRRMCLVIKSLRLLLVGNNVPRADSEVLTHLRRYFDMIMELVKYVAF
jgi:hypothetical protein